MTHKGEKEKILETIAELPQQMEAGDIHDFCSLAVLYSAQTPFSYKRVRLNLNVAMTPIKILIFIT